MTQGEGGQVPLPYPSQPMQPEAIPRDSSTFVYNGRPLMTPQHVIVEDKDDYEEEVLTNSMLETINVMEERDTYKSRLDTTESALSSAEKALSKSLAREAQLRSELEDA